GRSAATGKDQRPGQLTRHLCASSPPERLGASWPGETRPARNVAAPIAATAVHESNRHPCSGKACGKFLFRYGVGLSALVDGGTILRIAATKLRESCRISDRL